MEGKCMQTPQRLSQSKFTGIINPEVDIISMTDNPVGTLFAVWHGSRRANRVSPKLVEELLTLRGSKDYLNWSLDVCDTAETILSDYPEYDVDKEGTIMDRAGRVVMEIVKSSLKASLPASNCVHFTIEVEDATVAWREQLVRSKFADYWVWSSRVLDLKTMDINEPRSVKLLGGDEAVKIYHETADMIREAYRQLEELGVPMEDIRLQPQQQTHRVYWMIGLRALITVMNRRSDWIAQASLWTPIISGLCKQLRETSLWEVLEELIGKPPVKLNFNHDTGNYEVAEYLMDADSEDRYQGRDVAPCDPLWLSYKGLSLPKHTDLEFYDYMKSMFINIWSDEYLSVVGWDRNDPTKLGPYDRPVD